MTGFKFDYETLLPLVWPFAKVAMVIIGINVLVWGIKFYGNFRKMGKL